MFKVAASLWSVQMPHGRPGFESQPPPPHYWEWGLGAANRPSNGRYIKPVSRGKARLSFFHSFVLPVGARMAWQFHFLERSGRGVGNLWLCGSGHSIALICVLIISEYLLKKTKRIPFLHMKIYRPNIISSIVISVDFNVQSLSLDIGYWSLWVHKRIANSFLQLLPPSSSPSSHRTSSALVSRSL